MARESRNHRLRTDAPGHEIVLGVTGSIGAYKAADLVRRLREEGCGVTCVLTKEAAQFITPLTLQALSERKVYADMFSLPAPAGVPGGPGEESAIIPPPTASAEGGSAPTAQALRAAAGGGIIHTTLADRADLVLIAPATANIIGKLATGLADDLLTCIALATRAPILIAPAMNVHMYEHPVVQENLSRLKRLGHQFIGPERGQLACGYDAIGHIADVEHIVQDALRMLTASPARRSPWPGRAHRAPTRRRARRPA